jgi:hypothetical protein
VVRWSSVSSSEFAEFIHLHRSRDQFVDLNAYGGAPRRRLQIHTIQVSYESTSVTDLHDRGPPDRRDSPSQLTSTPRDCCKITHHPTYTAHPFHVDIHLVSLSGITNATRQPARKTSLLPVFHARYNLRHDS